RSQPNVWHALERNAAPRIRVAAAARFSFADQMRLIANGLIVLENPFFDDREARSLYAVVVILHRGHAKLGGTVAEEVHHVAADPEFSHLIGSQETCTGVIGFVPERSIQLCRVPNGLMNRQAEVARKQDQVLLA